MSRVPFEPAVEHVRNALAILVLYGDDPPPPSVLLDVQDRLRRALELWDAEAAEQEAALVRQALQWDRDHPDAA